MNFVCSGEVKVPQNVLNTIKGTKADGGIPQRKRCGTEHQWTGSEE